MTGWIVFLSSEPYRGPLTLNLPEYPPALRSVASGTVVEIQAGNIHFIEQDLIIQLASTPAWLALRTPDAPVERIAWRLQQLEKAVLFNELHLAMS